MLNLLIKSWYIKKLKKEFEVFSYFIGYPGGIGGIPIA